MSSAPLGRGIVLPPGFAGDGSQLGAFANLEQARPRIEKNKKGSLHDWIARFPCPPSSGVRVDRVRGPFMYSCRAYLIAPGARIRAPFLVSGSVASLPVLLFVFPCDRAEFFFSFPFSLPWDPSSPSLVSSCLFCPLFCLILGLDPCPGLCFRQPIPGHSRSAA